MGFYKQEYWSGLPVPSPGIFWPKGQTCVSCIGRQILYHQCHLGSQIPTTGAKNLSSFSLTAMRTVILLLLFYFCTQKQTKKKSKCKFWEWLALSRQTHKWDDRHQRSEETPVVWMVVGRPQDSHGEWFPSCLERPIYLLVTSSSRFHFLAP